MRKKKRRRSAPAQLVKQAVLGAIFFVLIWLLTQLSGSFALQQPVALPGSLAEVKLYSNQTQDDLTHIYQQAIESAQQSITLAIYGLADDTIIQSLGRKCEAGITVHIVCDAQASKGISRRLPNAVVVKRVGKGLMHQKILIIDNRLIWFGSANLTYSSLNIHGNLVMGLDHPSLAQALAERIKSMDDEGAFIPLLHQETTAGGQKLELWVLPDEQAADQRMIELFRSAKKSIKVAMFTWTRTDFTQELIAAAQRGVKVEAVVDRHSGTGKGASAKIVRMLEKGGIPVALSTGQGLLHHKFAYIDESILVNGSANWTQDAFKKNDDYFVIITPLSPDQQLKMNHLYHTIKNQSKTVEVNKTRPSG